MNSTAVVVTRAKAATRRIVQTTGGRGHGPITRLVSPSDIGELIKPFVFLDHFEVAPRPEPFMGIHPHSGIGHDRKDGHGPDRWARVDESRKRRVA